jgi:NarL family two-component system response regulator LiaR
MSEPLCIKVMIVDDHDMVRTGLRTYLMLEPKLEAIAEAGSGQAAIDLLATLAPERRPDIILMDLMMPGMDGIETTKRIIAAYPDMKIVMLTSFLEDDKVYGAIEAGAVSYVLKTVSAEELIYAITGAYKGMPVMTSDVSQALTRGLRQRTAQSGDEGLTGEGGSAADCGRDVQQGDCRGASYQHQDGKNPCQQSADEMRAG